MRQCVANLFVAAGLSSFRLAQEIDALIARTQWAWRKRLGIAILLSFVAGFGVCYAWVVAQVNVLQNTVSAWKVQYDAEHAKHHAKETKPINKAAAQVIVEQIERRRMEDTIHE